MKGIVVKSNIAGKKDFFEIAIPDGVVDVMINFARYNGAYWSVGGLKMPDCVNLSWTGGHLAVGDEIQVEFADIDKMIPPVHRESFSTIKERMAAVADEDDDVVDLQRKLERYYRLKAILEDEKLIEASDED